MKNWFEINDCASRYHDTNEARVYLCRVMENAIQAVQWQDWMNTALAGGCVASYCVGDITCFKSEW